MSLTFCKPSGFGTSDSDLIRALQQSTQATTNRAGQRLIERQLNVQPTITVLLGLPVPSYAALGVLNMGAAFGLQCLTGFIVALWPADGGRYPAEAHQAALGLNLVLQAAAFVWFIRPQRKPALQHLPAHPIHALATSLGLVPAAALSYARARHAWSLQMVRARAQEKAWRSAAFASFAVLALLLSSLGSTILGTSVAAPVIEGAQLTETRDFAGADSERSKPSFMLDRPAEVVPASLALSRSHHLLQGREP